MLSADVVSIKLGPEKSKEVHHKIVEKKTKPTVNRPRNSIITDITLRREARKKEREQRNNYLHRGFEYCHPAMQEPARTGLNFVKQE